MLEEDNERMQQEEEEEQDRLKDEEHKRIMQEDIERLRQARLQSEALEREREVSTISFQLIIDPIIHLRA